MQNIAFLAIAFSLALGVPARAQEVIAVYTAVIAPQDRFNSRGQPLDKIDQIIAQDRANFHRFGLRQPGDEPDPVFSEQAWRAEIPRLLSRGFLSPEARAAIASGGDAVIRVAINGTGSQPSSISVMLAEPAAQAAVPVLPPEPLAAWSFAPEAEDRLGVARVALTGDTRVSLECLRPGIESASLVGVATAGLHEPGSVTMFLTARAVGLPGTTAPGTLRNVEIAIDGRAVGAAQMLYVAATGDLAMNIPATHPVFATLRAGSVLTLADQSSGARADATLNGSGPAIEALLGFCASTASPVARSDPPALSQVVPSPSAVPGQTVTPQAEPSGSPTQPAVAATTPQPARPGCETSKSGWRTVVQCFEADGSKAPGRVSTKARVQYGLQLIGCPVPRLTGNLADSREAIACFNEMFDIGGLRLQPKAEAALLTAADWGERDKAMEVLLQRGFDPEARAKREASARDFLTTPGHPEQQLFAHPASRASFLGAVTDLGEWVTSRYTRDAARTRWGDASAFAGRTFSLVDEEVPRFLVSFGETAAEVTAYVDGATEDYTASYGTRNGLECAQLAGVYDGQCLSLILASVSGAAKGQWTMHGALVISQNGWPVPIGFGAATEGRAAFDAALAARRQGDAEIAAAIATGRELDALPVDGLAGPTALAARLYETPSSVSLEPYVAQRLPFLSYHRAYAVACAGQFRGPVREYRVIGQRLAEFSYIPFNKYEVWETYSADAFPVQSDAFGGFSQGMEELVPSLMREASDPLGDRMLMADRMLVMDRKFNSWAIFHADLLKRIGCSGRTVERYENALTDFFNRRTPI